jgi:glycosyltransferase involved in cell wall biosynthesis
MKSSIKVSVLSITYNQSDYIRQMLDSFIEQKTDFKFEVVVHDDASTDGTKEILEEYQEKYPEIIRPIFEEENQYSKENFEFITDMYKNANGKYIAFCEGDDYWTDKNKLQIQVDYMESNPKDAICFHKVKVFFENKEEDDYSWPSADKEFTLRALLKENFIQTNTVLYRKQDYSSIKADVMPGDWYLHLFHAQFGEIHFMDRVMSAYRKHDAGVWWDSYESPHKLQIKFGIKFLNLNKEIIRMYGDKPEYKKIINDRICNDIRSLAQVDIDHNTQLIVEASKKYPDFIDIYSKKILSEANKLEPLRQEEGSLRLQLSEQRRKLEDSKRSADELSSRLVEITDRLNTIEQSRTWRLRNKIARVLKKDEAGEK